MSLERRGPGLLDSVIEIADLEALESSARDIDGLVALGLINMSETPAPDQEVLEMQ